MDASDDGDEPLGEAPEIVGSLDNRTIEFVDTRDTVLAVVVFPDGTVRFRTDQPLPWVAETLQTLTDSVHAKIAEPEEAPR